jgi:hypothetical protein
MPVFRNVSAEHPDRAQTGGGSLVFRHMEAVASPLPTAEIPDPWKPWPPPKYEWPVGEVTVPNCPAPYTYEIVVPTQCYADTPSGLVVGSQQCRQENTITYKGVFDSERWTCVPTTSFGARTCGECEPVHEYKPPTTLPPFNPDSEPEGPIVVA